MLLHFTWSNNFNINNDLNMLPVQKHYRLDASLSSSCVKLVGFIKLNQVCESQTRCSLIFEDLLHVVEITFISLVDKKSRQTICIMIKPVDNL